MPKDLMNFYFWYMLCNAEQEPEDEEDEDNDWEDWSITVDDDDYFEIE